MKAKSLIYVLGFRPKPRTYGFEVRSFDLPEDGRVEYARWLHPLESEKALTQESVDELRTFLRPGDAAIDIGAHTGDSTLPIALAVGAAGRVFALEPNRFVFPVLEKNAQLNPGRTAIVPLMFAATEHDGRRDFDYSDPGFCNGGCHEGQSLWRHAHAFRQSVEGKNLPSYLGRHHAEWLSKIRYIKVDAEGNDLAVLKTLEGLLVRCRPYVKAEVYKHTTRAQREELLEFLRGHRFAVHRVESESRYRGERVDAAGVMRWRHFDVFCVPEELGAAAESGARDGRATDAKAPEGATR
ncbi:MAG: FkbM family methyltransferase [bacterium]